MVVARVVTTASPMDTTARTRWTATKAASWSARAIWTPRTSHTPTVHAAERRTTRLWDVERGVGLPPLTLETGHKLLAATFAPDRPRIVTTSEDHVVHLALGQ